MDLQEFHPSPHPLKKIFEQHRISQIVLANYLQCSQGRVSQFLCGYSHAPAHVEAKLQKLAKHLTYQEEHSDF